MVSKVASDAGTEVVDAKLEIGNPADDDNGVENKLGLVEAKAAVLIDAKLKVCAAEPIMAVPPKVVTAGTQAISFSLFTPLASLAELLSGSSVKVTEVFSGSLLPKLNVLNADVFLSVEDVVESVGVCCELVPNNEGADGNALPKFMLFAAGELPLPKIEPVPPNIVEALVLATLIDTLLFNADVVVTLVFANETELIGVIVDPLVILEDVPTFRPLEDENGPTLAVLLRAGKFELEVTEIVEPKKLPPLEPSLLPENMDTGADDTAAATGVDGAGVFEKYVVGVDTDEVDVLSKPPKNEPPIVDAGIEVGARLLANKDGT